MPRKCHGSEALVGELRDSAPYLERGGLCRLPLGVRHHSRYLRINVTRAYAPGYRGKPGDGGHVHFRLTAPFLKYL